MVVVGRIVGAYGVRGWIRIHSDCSPREAILGYSPWYLDDDGGWEKVGLREGRQLGKSVIALLEGIGDRDVAGRLLGRQIAVRRDQLPALESGDYYWTDLEGLRVETSEGETLGTVHHLFETGANDVMVVRGERERLIPYVWEQVVRKVDTAAGIIVVEWDPDF